MSFREKMNYSSLIYSDDHEVIKIRTGIQNHPGDGEKLSKPGILLKEDPGERNSRHLTHSW